MAKALGVLGGSFNPVHFGHLLIAQEAHYRFDLGRVIFVPAAQNPLKEPSADDATAAQRLAMLQLATEPDVRFSVDAYDLRRPGPTYMVETMERLARINPGARLHMILGADCALELPRWKEAARLLDMCFLVICDRPGSSTFASGLPAPLAGFVQHWEFMPVPAVDISASGIRARARQGKPIRYLTPDAVAHYIVEHRLYA